MRREGRTCMKTESRKGNGRERTDPGGRDVIASGRLCGTTCTGRARVGKVRWGRAGYGTPGETDPGADGRKGEETSAETARPSKGSGRDRDRLGQSGGKGKGERDRGTAAGGYWARCTGKGGRFGARARGVRTGGRERSGKAGGASGARAAGGQRGGPDRSVFWAHAGSGRPRTHRRPAAGPLLFYLTDNPNANFGRKPLLPAEGRGDRRGHLGLHTYMTGFCEWKSPECCPRGG